MAIKLTDARVAAAAKGCKRTSIMDAVEPGLELRVAKKGATFALRRSVAGKDVRVTLGRYPALSLSDARSKALALKARLEKEGDFREKERADEAAASERRAYTVQKLIDDWEAHARSRGKLKDSTLAHYAALHRVHIAPALGALPVVAQEELDVAAMALLEDAAVKKRRNDEEGRTRLIGGRRTANEVAERIDVLWKYARTVKKMRGLVSPAEGYDPFPEAERERTLTSDTDADDGELKTAWAALGNPKLPPGPQLKLALKIALVTCQRIGEVIGMHEAELNFETRLWTVPAARRKLRKTAKQADNIVPLSPLAVRLIRQALALRGKRDKPGFVFPSAKKPKEGQPETHMGRRAASRAMARLCAKIGMERTTPHDLRRSARTLMRQPRVGVDLEAAERVMAHAVESKSASPYEQNRFIEMKRQALERLAAVLEQIVEGARGPNVVALRP